MTAEPHPDSPVYLTAAGEQAWKATQAVEALFKIGLLAARPKGLHGSLPTDAYDLGAIIGHVIFTLDELGESEKAAKVRAAFDDGQLPRAPIAGLVDAAGNVLRGDDLRPEQP